MKTCLACQFRHLDRSAIEEIRHFCPNQPAEDRGEIQVRENGHRGLAVGVRH